MKMFTAVIEKCPDTDLYVGSVPGFPGAHSQAETLDELNKNLKEVIEMFLEDGEPEFEGEFIGTQNVMVAQIHRLKKILIFWLLELVFFSKIPEKAPDITVTL